MMPWERNYAAPEAEAPAAAAGPRPWERSYATEEPKEAPKSKRLLDRALMGMADIATGAGKLGANILAPYDIAADVVQGRPMGTGNRQRMADIESFGRQQGADDWTSVVNQAAPEMVATAGPLAKVEQVVAQQAAKRLPRAVARATGAAADIGTNAAYSGAQAAAQGQDVGDAAGTAALVSGGVRAGLALPSALLRKGASQVRDPNALKLQEAGLPVTPGMLYPESWVAGAERTARNLPIMGGEVERAEGRLGREYIKGQAQEAVDPLVRVVPGQTSVHAAPEVPTTANPQTVPPVSALPRATGREVGPSMVEPIPGRPGMLDDTIHVDSQGNAGRLSTEVRPPPEPGAVGPFTRDTVEGTGPTRAANEAPPRQPGETFDQTMTTAPRASPVTGEGLDLVRNAQRHVDEAYNEVVPHTFLRADNGVSALLHSSNDLNNIPWLTLPQRRQVKKFINDRMIPRLEGLGPNAILSGREVKNLDAMLGEQARGFAEDATTKPMADALYAIQHRLRVATEGNTPAHRHALQLANESFRKLLPITAATEQSLGSTGIPSAIQLRQAMKKYNMEPDALNDAMVQVAPNAPSSNQLNRRLVGSGLGLAGLATGAALPVIGAMGLVGGLGKAAYSRAGVKAQLSMLDLPRRLQDRVERMSLTDQVKMLNSFAGQTAREIEGEQNAP